MAKVDVYNNQGKAAGDIDVSDAVFGVEGNDALVHQVYVALEANARQPLAHVKTKGEVRGGGKKPWRQKGTGRARHGSNRSPLWVGGGITFGPRNVRNFTKRINRKMKQSAVRMCLSAKVADKKFIVLDQLQASGKTKEMAALRKVLPGAGKSTLVLTDKSDDQLFLATRNVPQVHLQRTADVNVVDLLHHQYIITTKDGVKALEKRLA